MYIPGVSFCEYTSIYF